MNQSKLTSPRPLPCLKNFFTPISKARYQFQVLKDQLLADERAMQQKENDEQAKQNLEALRASVAAQEFLSGVETVDLTREEQVHLEIDQLVPIDDVRLVDAFGTVLPKPKRDYRPRPLDWVGGREIR
jgi:ethanolamine ammonia-lyase large subunit